MSREAMTEWRTITKDAPPPRDGTEILVWAKAVRGSFVGCFMARWNDAIARWTTDIADGLDGDTLEIENVTHWLPLPAPPESAEP